MPSLANLWRHPGVQLGLWLAVVTLALHAWQGRQQRALGDRVAAAAAPGDLRMLSSTTCGVCSQARRWFVEHEVAFSECFVERDPVCRSDLEALRAPGTPVILVRGQPQLGFSPPKLARALEAQADEAGG